MTIPSVAAPTFDDPLAGLPDLTSLSRTDERTLRQVPTDRERLVRAVRDATRRLEWARVAGDATGELAPSGYLGNALRIVGRTAEAIAHLTRAVALAGRSGSRAPKSRT